MPTHVPILARGDEGSAVRLLQARLNTAEPHWPLVVDGAFGPRTEERLRRVQIHLGVPVDVVWGPLTAAALAQQEQET